MKVNFYPNEQGNIIELDADEKANIKRLFFQQEEKFGINGFVSEDVKNSCDNDDYLFLWHIMHQKVNKVYLLENIVIPPNIWRPNYREVPYIHLEFVDFNSSYTLNEDGTEAVVDDKKLRIKSKGPVINEIGEYYILYVDKKFLAEYMKFLSNLFYYNNDERPEEIVTPFGTFDSSKPIFCTSGFREYSNRKDELICRILINSMMTIFAHEFTHASNAHLKLKAKEKEYAENRNVSFCLETNADDNAIRLILASLFYYGKHGTGDYNLALSYDEFVEKWSLKSFSAFVALTWAYRGHDREWSENTVSDYLKAISLEHPQYQLRAHNVVNRAVNHIYAVLSNADNKRYRTSDNYMIDCGMAEHIIGKTIDMIRSFDYCMYYIDTPDIEMVQRLYIDTYINQQQTGLTGEQSSPISLLFNNQDAIELNEQIKSTWPEVKAKLQEYNPYCMLYEAI